jgi:hypothetical protein
VWLWGLSELLKASAKSERYCTLKKKSERELGRWVYSLISSHRPIVFRPAAGFKQKAREKEPRLASPRRRPTNQPPAAPSLSPIGCFRRRLRRAASPPDVASSTGQARAPFLAGIGNPESPNHPSEARGNEQAGRRCRASLRPAPSPCARSTATSVHAPPPPGLIQSIPTALNQLVSAIRAQSRPSFLWSLSQLRQMPCPMTAPRKPTGMSLSVHFPRNFALF